MKKYIHFLIILVCLTIYYSCSDDAPQTCSESENIFMEINDELKQFDVNGRGIDLNIEEPGHTLSIWLMSGIFEPQQDTETIIIKLPYLQTGSNIIEEFSYLGIQNGTYVEIDLVTEGSLESNVTVNTNTCFNATFSGSIIVDGNEIFIDGILEHTYDDPFD